jgi:hypothetical protein
LSHSPSCRIEQPNPFCGCKNAETAAVLPIAPTVGMPDAWVH